ncbi:hypothetical protein V8E55_008197 [Tylopilus felleus]
MSLVGDPGTIRQNIAIEPLGFSQKRVDEQSLRNTSTKSEERARKYANERGAKVTAAANLRKTGAWETLSAGQKRLIDKMFLDGMRAGLALEKKDKEQLKWLVDNLSDPCLKFTQNFNEESMSAGRIAFTREQLYGVPEDVISGYTQRTEGDTVLYEVTFRTPGIFPLFKYANYPKTSKIAEILQYDSWADYITEFLDDLKSHLDPLGIKTEEHLKRGLPFDDTFTCGITGTPIRFVPWSLISARYYDRLFVERSLNLDDSLVKEYFLVSVVVPAILNIYNDFFGVEFVEFTGDAGCLAPRAAFSVWEKDVKDRSGFVGYCYLDLSPRDCKYSHAPVWGLLPGCSSPMQNDTTVGGMVANLAKPTPERYDIRTRFSRFHGTAVARDYDYVEAPSQMLENWLLSRLRCWEPEVVRKMSSHYKTQEPLSDDLITKIIKSRYVNLWNELREKISLVKGGDKPGQGTMRSTRGESLVPWVVLSSLFLTTSGGTRYTCSLVFAVDMCATLAKLYRDNILLVGGSWDDMDSLKDFLGREPSPMAFINEIEKGLRKIVHEDDSLTELSDVDDNVDDHADADAEQEEDEQDFAAAKPKERAAPPRKPRDPPPAKKH